MPPSKAKQPKIPAASAKRRTAAPVLSARERYLQKVCDQLNLPVPPFEVMFARQIERGLPAISLTQLAVFNSLTLPFSTATTPLAKAVLEVSHYFGDRNFLNKNAEVDPLQVHKVLVSLLETGSLTHAIKSSMVEEAPDYVRAEYDMKYYQTWDGRHRLVAFAIMYGPTAEIPMEISHVPYDRALRDTILSNNTRAIKKLEMISYQGLVDGTQAVAAYKRKGGDRDKIAKWIVSQITPGMAPNPALKPLTQMRIVEKVKGIPAITGVNMTHVIKEALSNFAKPHFDDREFTPQTRSTINIIVDTIQRTYMAIDQRSGGTKTSLAWNSYTSITLGNIIGRGLRYYMNDALNVDGETREGLAQHVAEVVCSYMDAHPDTYAQKPSGKIDDIITTYAGTVMGMPFPGVQLFDPVLDGVD